MEEPVIRVRGLRKCYGSHVVLDGIDLDAARGTVLGLLGRNGAGKTTTVNILTTLLRPDAGAVTVAGADVVAAPRAVRERIALTGQFASVDDFLTGEENLVMMGRLAHLTPRAARVRAGELLERFNLTGAARRRVATYSGGMRRRLDLALSLVTDRPVLFLDEPTTGLDPLSRTQLWAVVRELADGGTTVLLTTQYLDEAERLADQVAVLHDGRLVASGTPAQLKSLAVGDHVRLELADGKSFATANALHLPGAVADDGALTLTLPATDSVATLREVLALADQHALAVAGLTVVRPTLDDVFLALTSTKEAA